MKNILYILMANMLFAMSCAAQTKVSETQNCDFLKEISFKNGIDTLVLKGTYMSLGKLDPMSQLEQLEQKKILKSKEFTYALVFKPEHCAIKFYIPSRDQSKEALSLFSLQTDRTVYVTLIFFKGYDSISLEYKDAPFFIVDKIRFNEK